MDTSQLMDRMIRAARLDPQLYEEVEADTTAMPQAMLVVVLSSVTVGIAGIGRGGGIEFIILNTIVALAGWYIWAFLTYWIGTRLLPEPQTEATHSDLLRTIGFAAAPGVIRIIGIIPPLSSVVFLVANIWMLAAMVVAIRQALDYSGTLRALGVCVIGWIVQAAVVLVVALLFGGSHGGV
jgi:hypothetical protein